jgi:hypothetical protein
MTATRRPLAAVLRPIAPLAVKRFGPEWRWDQQPQASPARTWLAKYWDGESQLGLKGG